MEINECTMTDPVIDATAALIRSIADARRLFEAAGLARPYAEKFFCAAREHLAGLRRFRGNKGDQNRSPTGGKALGR